MSYEQEGPTNAELVYADLSVHPFELVSFQHFETMYGLRGVALRVHVGEARKNLSPDCAIFGVWGEGYTFINTPVAIGDIVSIKGIRPFSQEVLGKRPAHVDEIATLVASIQKGIVCDRPIITPVIPDEEYRLLLYLIPEYAHNRTVSLGNMEKAQRTYTLNLLGRLRRVLQLATENQWDIANAFHHTLHYLQFSGGNGE
jgi:hypothetical protein